MTLTISEFGRKLRAREISAVEMVEESLRRIRSTEALNAFILVMAEQAHAQARDADRELAAGNDRGVLHGVPISVKDLFDMAGAPTTAASRVRDGHIAERNATAIDRLRAAGAVIVGKTNLHEFAFGPTNEESAFGPSRNPHDPTRSPGGSSGGSAVSLVTQAVLGTIGTDTGGSIRIPAAACGAVGLKPSYGEVPIDGVVPLSTTLDHVGPLAMSVQDSAYLYSALIGNEWPIPLNGLSARDIRLAVLRPYFCDVLEEDVRSQFEAAVARLRALGARVVEAAIDCASLIPSIYTHISFGDAAAYHASALEIMPERYTPAVRMRLESARYVMAEDYVRALAGREVLRSQVDAVLSGCDALILPTIPIQAPPLGADSLEIHGTSYAVRPLLLKLTQLFNLTGNPAITLPCGFTSAGLPCGLQLAGRRLQTARLLRVAHVVEQALASDVAGAASAHSEQAAPWKPSMKPAVDAE